MLHRPRRQRAHVAWTAGVRFQWFSGLVARRSDKAAKLALDQRRKSKRRAIFQVRTDDLHADWQAILRALNRHHCGWQAWRSRQPRPYRCNLEVGD